MLYRSQSSLNLTETLHSLNSHNVFFSMEAITPFQYFFLWIYNRHQDCLERWTVVVYDWIFIFATIVVCQLNLEKRERSKRTTQLCKKVVMMRPDTWILSAHDLSAIQSIFSKICWSLLLLNHSWSVFSYTSLLSPFPHCKYSEDEAASLWKVQDNF